MPPLLPNNGDTSRGDVNGDGLIDVADAELLLRYLSDPFDPALPPGIGLETDDTLAGATEVSLGSSTAGSLLEGSKRAPTTTGPASRASPVAVRCRPLRLCVQIWGAGLSQPSLTAGVEKDSMSLSVLRKDIALQWFMAAMKNKINPLTLLIPSCIFLLESVH